MTFPGIKKNVLIINNDYDIREKLITALNDEYVVFDVEEWKEAIEIVSQNSIDVILLDIKLFEIHGLEVLEEIKKINKEIIVILITVYGTKEVLISALELKMDDGYFERSFEIRKIKERIGEGCANFMEIKKR